MKYRTNRIKTEGASLCRLLFELHCELLVVIFRVDNEFMVPAKQTSPWFSGGSQPQKFSVSFYIGAARTAEMSAFHEDAQWNLG
jgi:hypothetical protein